MTTPRAVYAIRADKTVTPPANPGSYALLAALTESVNATEAALAVQTARLIEIRRLIEDFRANCNKGAYQLIDEIWRETK